MSSRRELAGSGLGAASAAAGFNPYHKWLEIPPGDQPPYHYRLLGIDPFESEPQGIESAADRQMMFLRTFQNGPKAEHSQRRVPLLALSSSEVGPSGSRKYSIAFFVFPRRQYGELPALRVF